MCNPTIRLGPGIAQVLQLDERSLVESIHPELAVRLLKSAVVVTGPPAALKALADACEDRGTGNPQHEGYDQPGSWTGSARKACLKLHEALGDDWRPSWAPPRLTWRQRYAARIRANKAAQ